MRLVTKPAVAMLIICAAVVASGVAFAPADVGAQAVPSGNANEGSGTPTTANGVGQLTGKERLGDKWKDEQRINNCKVPLARRGTKQRPDNCAHALTR